ncbi:L7Ae/L30e/S12e/Gadd45 family ribosomal protein [Bittarella massiliensis (ex Durand et al. 2017)]|uniref:L7Ae/L30e/S12e/Gadd45 family ribosomal protein n=1 Tax=Bittarella massiliensis (ex Durand et al. 2017) TaxID=1720313 RepID=UPI001AA119B0|nr:ribosomal L7Ae/L30e/S12e/Gadd45 family protein [Bittarella massiliensis (ex Durand et al. 2017)]MBO1678713.1 hypothetical protein [Bittarella massiliensis (ex Durand et al. 2017)]
MESREKLLNMLSLCRKAGKLSMGFDSAKEALVRKASRLCLLAADCSPKTAKEVRFFCGREEVSCKDLPFRRGDLSKRMGKEYTVFSVNDDSFAASIQNLLTCTNEEDCVYD